MHRLMNALAVSTLLIATALTSCKKDLSPAALLDDNPAQACASASTSAGLWNIAFGDFSQTAPLVKSTSLVIDTPLLDAVDTTTKKVSCSANLSIKYGPELAPFANAAPMQITGVKYSLQPAADGSGVVYVLPTNAVAELQALAGEVIQAKIAANSPPKAAAASSSTSAPAGVSNATSVTDNQTAPPAQSDGDDENETGASPAAPTADGNPPPG